MRILITFILLLSSSAFSAVKVNITKDGALAFSATWPDQATAENWVANNETLAEGNRNSFGLADHWLSEDLGNSIDTRLDINGATEYKYPQNYSVAYVDATAEVAAAVALDNQIKDMAFGRNLHAKITLLVKGKSLSKSSRRAMRTSLKDILSDIQVGELCDARADIVALNPANLPVEQADLDAVIALIDAYKTCI